MNDRIGGISLNTLTIVNNPRTFLEKTENMLLSNESQNNLMLGLLYKALTTTNLKGYFFAYVENENKIQIAFLKTPNKNLIMSSHIPITEEALYTVITQLLQLDDFSIPGIIGERKLATSFAKVWKVKTGIELIADMEQLIYQLDEVNEATIGPEEMRLANEKDTELISDWIYEFSLITPEHLSIEDSKIKAVEFINEKTVYLLVDGGSIVSMAKESRPTKNGVVVTLVYTPKEYRKRGYATSLVARLSRHLLAEGYQFCSLYTDLANPTSNHIYSEIGYKPISESIMYSFKSCEK